MKKTIPEKTDFVVIAGGDGMVRKVVGQMLERRIIDGTFPLAVIPLGTANNIAKTLGLPTEPEEVIKSWRKGKTRNIDVARLNGLKSSSFFIEGLGFGIFPQLITEMKQKENKSDDPEKEINTAVRKFHQLSRSMKPNLGTLTVDGEIFKGSMLMMEVMNMKTVGPNLLLASDADPSDGKLDVTYVTEDERQALTDFIQARMDGADQPLKARTVRGTCIQLITDNELIHVDDKLHEIRKEGVVIDLRKNLLEFLI